MENHLRIMLIRHGQTSWNAEGNRYCGCTDIELDATGRRQASALGKRLQNLNINAVYASPLKRALQTASAITQYHHIDVIEKEGLREWDFGDWEGIAEKEIISTFPEQYELWKKRPDHARIPNGEMASEVRERCVPAFRDILAQHRPGQQICIVSHNMINRLLLTEIAKADLASVRIWIQKNTCINQVLWDGEQFRIETINDARHLAELDGTN